MAYKVKGNPKMIKWAREDVGYEFEELPKSHAKAHFGRQVLHQLG